MKRYLYTIVFMFISCTFIYGQEINHEVRCYYAYGKTQLDTVCSIEHIIYNKTGKTQVIMITEDSKKELPLNRIIRRRLFRSYGDLSFAQMALDNIENCSDYSLVPEFLVKIVQPNDSFKITLELKNEDVNRVKALFLEHLLVLDAESIDNENMVSGLLSAIKEHHFEYPYPSIDIPWCLIKSFFKAKE